MRSGILLLYWPGDLILELLKYTLDSHSIASNSILNLYLTIFCFLWLAITLSVQNLYFRAGFCTCGILLNDDTFEAHFALFLYFL